MGTELYPHQVEAVGKLSNGSVLVGGVGSGKSMTALAYFATKVIKAGEINGNQWSAGHPGNPKDLYIITTALKRDKLEWEEEAVRFSLSGDPAASLGGVRVVVDSWNNIKKYVGTEGAFFIFDEQRLVGSGAWVKAFLKIAAGNEWILLSATPGDTWIDYIPLFVAHGFYPNRTAFIERHVVYKRYVKYPVVDKFIEVGRLEDCRRAILVDMPVARHTTRHVEEVAVSYPFSLLKQVTKTRFNPYTEKPMKGAAELCQVARRVVLSDPSRLTKLLELLEDHPKAIVFYNYNYELEALRGVLEAARWPYSEWNGHKHEPLPEGDKWVFLVQYTAGAEGWNCTTTDSMILFSLNYSYRVTEQAKGRIDRMNTPYSDLYYYTFMSQSWIDVGVKRSLDGKENFSESAFSRKMRF